MALLLRPGGGKPDMAFVHRSGAEFARMKLQRRIALPLQDRPIVILERRHFAVTATAPSPPLARRRWKIAGRIERGHAVSARPLAWGEGEHHALVGAG